MPIQKEGVHFWDGESVLGGGTKTSSAHNLETYYGALYVLVATCGSPAPTSAAYMVVEVSIDGTTWFELTRIPIDRYANAVTKLNVRVPPEVMRSRVQFENGATNGVTVDGVIQYVTTRG